MGESGSWTRVDDHITLGTGIDGIAIPPGTRQTATTQDIHTTDSMVTIDNIILFLLLFNTLTET